RRQANLNIVSHESTSSVQLRHHLVGDELNQFFNVGTGLPVTRLPVAAGPGADAAALAAGVVLALERLWLRHELAVAALEDAVAAQVAILHAEARVVVAQPLLDGQKLASF